MIVDKPSYSNQSNLKTAVKSYQDDLKGYDDIIEAKYQLWQSKWNLVESKCRLNLRLSKHYNSVNHQCTQICMSFLNYYQITILPVSTATAESSFSTLRRSKNYHKNTTAESRLVGLSLFSIHRNRNITDDMMLDKFSNNGKARRLKLTI